MNRRSIIVCTIVAVVLLAGIGCLFCSLFFWGDGKSVETDRLTDGVEAVPSDAIFLFEAGSLSEISEMTDDGSALGKLIGCIPSVSSDWEAALSMHYSSKNTVSPLLVLSVPEKAEPALFLDEVLDKCSGVIQKRYGQVTVYNAAVPQAAFAVYGRFLVASPSLVMVESSLRHLENGTSVKDEPLYNEIAGVTSKRGVIHVNFSNLGKLFSGAAAKEYIRYASFFQSLAEWGAFGIAGDDSPFTFDGRVISTRSDAVFSKVLLTQRGRKPEVCSVIPYNASYVLTLPLSSYKDYVSAYRKYMAASGKKKKYDESASEAVSSLGLQEVAVFSYAAEGGRDTRVMALRISDRNNLLSAGKDTVCDYPYAGYISSILGNVFRPSSEEAYCVLDGWALIGARTELNAIRNSWKSGSFFSLQDYLEQTPAADELREMSCFSIFVNAARYADSLASYFREPYSGTIRSIFGKSNFEYLFLNTYSIGEDLGVRASFYNEDMRSLPQPEESSSAGAVVGDMQVEIPSGPFPVRNFIDGSTNYLEQLDNNSLRLLNSSRKPVWTVRFGQPLCGTVRQIDYLKNDKLQMLFGAGNKVYLLDRLGRTVRDFPVTLEKEILLGPDVYDFKGSKDYTMMILHTDNTLAHYRLDGKRVDGWKDISLSDRIMSLPQSLEVGGDFYWVVRTSYQTLIYDMHGTVCADFTKKRKLRRDTAVEPVSSHEVAVTVFDGKEMILDLTDGSFRKR